MSELVTISTTLPRETYEKIKANRYKINQLITFGLKYQETLKQITLALQKLEEEIITIKKDVEMIKSTMQFLLKYVGKS